MFRIAQQDMGNALKHGHAKSVVIALASQAETCSLRIVDDGVGFTEKNREPTGMGLSIMRYRTRMIVGRLEIQSNSPTGTA